MRYHVAPETLAPEAKPVQIQIDHRCGIKCQRLAQDQASHDRDAQRLPQLGAFAQAKCKRQRAEQGGHCRHHDGTETKQTGFATFFSRTRNKLWMKGETSGNKLQVVEMLTDCDDDTVLVKVKRLGDGNVCHTGERTCFFKTLES